MGRPSFLSRLLADRRGASAVEFALALPVLILMLLGAFDFARAFSARLDLEQAAGRAAELATAPGQVRADYAHLASEAVAAANDAGLQNALATVDFWLECNGVRQGQTNAVCLGGAQIARYVSVRVRAFHAPLFGLAGLAGSNGMVLVEGAATVRLQ
ncbi:TadE/TadG family type IV pilus assembly protein [Sandaracinobacteroides sp. A072]|uniref:TadE/TadG family type IV pilus assembly protein n=1 Tax=Sandaracinobacteroides sp. A072 TaxID=3461146 RepID=UPI0040428FB5